MPHTLTDIERTLLREAVESYGTMDDAGEALGLKDRRMIQYYLAPERSNRRPIPAPRLRSLCRIAVDFAPSLADSLERVGEGPTRDALKRVRDTVLRERAALLGVGPDAPVSAHGPRQVRVGIPQML